MKNCQFMKVLILCSLIFFTNTPTSTHTKIIVPSSTYAYINNDYDSKTYKLINNVSLINKNCNVNYDEIMVVSCSKDLDGDNLKESIELIYNGDFILKIDDKQILVEKNVYYCPRNILLCPNLEIIDEIHDKYKTIVISYSEAIHQTNPKVQTWTYQYKNKEIRPLEK